MSLANARHTTAAVAMKLAKDALESHDGPKSGPEHQAKLDDLVRVIVEHARAGLVIADEELKRLEREEADAALQADRCDTVG